MIDDGVCGQMVLGIAGGDVCARLATMMIRRKQLDDIPTHDRPRLLG